MSFLKIYDPAKRDLLVAELHKTKKNIQQNFLSEKLGDIGLQQELTKIYKPIVDSQSTISKEQSALLSSIKDNSATTSNALQALPASISSSLKAIQYPQYPSIEAGDDPTESIRNLEFGYLATKYLKRYSSKNKLRDITFGIYSDDNDNELFYIGDNSIIDIKSDNVTITDKRDNTKKTYVGTPGLWELLTMKEPKGYNKNDLNNYGKILWATNAMRHKNNPNKPKSGPGVKYKEIIKPIWYAKTGETGETVGEETVGEETVGEEQVGEETVGEGVVVIPQDPNALVEMLSLRMASFQAGNTGARNEIVGICDELLRQGMIDADSYKKLMLRL